MGRYVHKLIILTSFTLIVSFIPMTLSAALQSKQVDVLHARKALFEQMESLTLIPWQLFAAIDQFERSIHKPNEENKDRLIAIRIPPSQWAGLLNPDYEDTNPVSIAFFDGMGRDGDGDGQASLTSDIDVLYSLALALAEYGTTRDDQRIALWNYYQQEKTVAIIMQTAELFTTYGTLDLYKKVFPIPKGYRYSYRGTWGDERGWGGYRIHEGTDIFASYGTPVRSTSYGYVEVIGWNKYGGWRVGIRDTNNVYHYYAHLAGFHKGLKEKEIVAPGQIIGYVGSSGYGKPGTMGKFPPHLHYGMYKYNGKAEWAFDPYPYLRRWERSK